MAPAVRGALFDFDMTLADSSYAITTCINLLADLCGLKKVSRQTVLESIGFPMEGCFRYYWGDFKQEWLDIYREKFRSEEQQSLKLYPSALPTLAALRARGVKVGVASNRRFAKHVTDITGLTPYLDAIVGLEDVKRAKPEPDVLLVGCEQLGVSPEESLYVGDTDIDMQTAVAAGVRGVGMTTGNFDAEALTGAGAWKVLDDLSGVVGFTEE
jgi:phosphoglycolate phosphatase